MEQYVVKGGNPLYGEVVIGGAKNAALAILAATLLTEETVQIENVPDVREDRVAELKTQIQNGTYNVSNESFADKLLAAYENRNA